jgi:GH25 family lysozyme M1 (1,4-beta-N-acetylmuramidase)
VIIGLDTASVGENQKPSPNWTEAKAAGLRFAIIRSHWGTARDRVFQRDWPKLKAAAITRGAYLFLRFPHPKYKMKAPAPRAQAQAFCDDVVLEDGDLPPSLDVEFPGDKRFPRKSGRQLTGLSALECLDQVMEAFNVLKAHFGTAPIVYTSARVWEEELDNAPAPLLAACPLWLARYPFKKGPAVLDGALFADGKHSPPVPPPWGDGDNWWIHQYQGDAVGFPGLPTGNVDMNRFNSMFKGSTGARVSWVQQRLGLPQNGRFDAAMDAKLRAFQENAGLSPDGVIGPRTFARLCAS